jgi:hypothetical protein
MPSIGRSVGTLSDAPVSAAKVVYQSWADSISSVTTPAGGDPLRAFQYRIGAARRRARIDG